MTTISEMDEFFNFEDAAHDQLPLGSNDIDFTHLNSGPYDIDLAFAEPENDENSFTCLQHFSTPEQQISSCLQNGTTDTTMMGPGDFSDFPRWIDGMDVPTQPCNYCRRMRIHCKVIKEGQRKGSCTSCVALARSCSLTVDPVTEGKRNSFKSSLKEARCDDMNDCFYSDQGEIEAGDWNNDNVMNPANAWNDETSPVVGSFSHTNSALNLVALKGSDENLNTDLGDSGPKIGARFSRESVRILRGWLSTHHRHPYPSDEEKESLKRQTGLNKTQITNWLANARRRGKVRAPRSTSPSVNNYANAIDIPRKATPGMEEMNPLERWKHSPPENEPASVTAIVKAVTSSTFSSGHDSPYTSYGHTDDGSNRSLCNVSSTSSLGTSQSSGGSFASAYSHKSRGSLGSFGSFGNRGRRRRRRQAPKAVKLAAPNQPVRTFQCTFCTETFKTKHDWQRHEKSLHLSLERWVCCPDGPTQFCSDYYHNRCVFCGLPNPPAGHAEEHNYSSCVERSLEERTFYRKDHLRQHLNLVHDVKFQAFSMETWKVATPEIRSRCGFCGIIMDSWTVRVDHLAEHFKGGKSMADWKGDWGFDSQVLDIVENGMPPYLIHDERSSMNPFEANKEIALPERTLADWVKIGLLEYLHEVTAKGATPTDDDLLLEARKIIRRADERTTRSEPEVSWFRDLIMLSGSYPELTGRQSQHMSWAEKLQWISAQAAQHAQAHDLDSIMCSKQRALKSFVNGKQALGLTPTNSELQGEACRILDDVEVQSNYKSKVAVDWFKYLITASTEWLEEFRRNVGLPRTSEMGYETIRSTDDKSIDYSIHNLGRLEKELVDYVNVQRAAGVTPTDADLQRQARLIVYGSDDPWNQTAADVPGLLRLFKRDNGLASSDDDVLLEHAHHTPDTSSSSSPRALHWDLENTGIALPSPPSGHSSGSGSGTPNYDQPLHTLVQNQPSANSNPIQPLKFFLNDAQCYGRLLRELTRFVKHSMSPNNPNQHIPTDAEIQHQARIVIYDDDDPWNQTAADNAEWLIRFKRDVGLAPPENGPGLSFQETQNTSWRCDKGGTGFSPPFVNPKEPPALYQEDVKVKMDDRMFDIKAKTAAQFIKNMSSRYQPPAQVFCSRDLENGLNAFVKSEVTRGICPTDGALRARAREIMNLEKTSADDADLLEKFKAMHGLPSNAPLNESFTPIDDAMLAEFDKDLENIDFSGMDFQFPASATTIPTDLGSLPADMTTLMDMEAAQSTMQNQSQDLGSMQEYADLFRVQAATSSPLRRRASERMAERSGFTLPTTSQLEPTEDHPVCDGDLVEEYERRETEKGLLTQEEIKMQGSQLLGRYLEKKWKEEGTHPPVLLASGRVKRLPGSGEVSVSEWEKWSKLVEEMEDN